MSSLMWKKGGQERFCNEVRRAFDKDSANDLFLICEKMPQQFIQNLSENEKIIETGLSGIGSGKVINASVRRVFLSEISLQIAKKMAKVKPEILNPHSFYDLYHACYYKSHVDKDVKIRWFCHEPDRWLYDSSVWECGSIHQRFFFSLFRTFSVPLDKKNVRLLVDSIACNSHHTADLVKKIYHRSSTIIYPGVNLDKFRLLKSNNKTKAIFGKELIDNQIILSVGRVDFSSKNLQIIPYVLKKIENKKKITWVHIGNGVDAEKLVILAKEMGVSTSFKLIDEVLDDYLIQCYRSADVVVYPSIAEPFGLVPLEAMACETPVIASKYGGTSETIINGQTGLLVDMSSINEISDAILYLLDNKSAAREIGIKGLKHVCENFNLKKTQMNFRRFILNERVDN